MMKKLVLIVLTALASALLAQPKVTVNPAIEHQVIQGFGAFGGIKPYWQSPPFFTEPFLDYLLNDLGATIVRTNIYWDLEPLNDNNSSADLDLSKFNFGEGSNLARQIPYYVALKEAGLKKLIATAWTPPVWMKLHDDPTRIPKECYNCNNCPVGDSRRKVCGGRLDPRYYGEYAEYLLAYVKILKQQTGIDLYAISIQNEPYFANPFESNVVKPDEYGTLLNVVGRKFRQEGMNTRIFGPEHMAEWSWGVQQNYVSNIFPDGGTNPYLDIYAVHGYVDGVAPDYGSAAGWTALHENTAARFQKPLWMTETSGYPQTMQGAMDLAKAMYLALRFGQVSAWLYWSVSGEPGSEFSIMANGEPTVLYYASRQFYKYIRPGAIRIDATSSDPALLTLAFKNPSQGSMTLMMINASDEQKEAGLDIAVGPAEFTSYRTSASENGVEAGIVYDHVTLPPQSITTLVGYGPAGPSIDEISNYYVHTGDEAPLEIPLSGISGGNAGALTIEVISSNEALVPVPTLSYLHPSSSGSLFVTRNTSAPGKAFITVKLTNSNPTDPSIFGFNTNAVSFTVEVLDVVTGVKKKENVEIKIYPNPASKTLVIEGLSVSGAKSILITNVRGERMKGVREEQITGDVFVVETGGWQPGVYFVSVMSGKKKLTEKIVIE